MCVLSVDGMLPFFEQETLAFGRFLPGFLLPCPVRYEAKTDAFITCSPSRVMGCYRYVMKAVLCHIIKGSLQRTMWQADFFLDSSLLLPDSVSADQVDRNCLYLLNFQKKKFPLINCSSWADPCNQAEKPRPMKPQNVLCVDDLMQ